jgi:signal transduction histidine kinase
MPVSRDELRNVATFAGLPDEQLDWFLEHATEFQLQPGDIYVRAGDPADKMLVLIEGELLVRLDPPDEGIYLTRAGTVTGVLPYSRMTIFPGTGRATKPSRGLTFPKSSFDDLLSHMPELGRRLVGTMVDRTREVTRAEQQRDRLAALGKLSAGLAHELNNPAAAVRRTAERLRAVVADFRSSVSQLEGIQLTEPERTAIEAFETGCCTQEPERDVLKASQLQDDIEEMLREHGIEDGWQYASSLVESGALPQPLHTMLEAVRPVVASPALKRVSAMVELNGLLDELEDSTSKISDLVKAIKEYSYMDQAPVQDVDVARGLEATLTILGHKLRKGITVERYYHPTPLLVNSYGSELNQVWTNIIDNAIDAMQGKGVLRIKTYADDGSAVVVIGDSGPGIPPDVQSHIFEPFFTTKGVGEGTGLGLDTVMRIIRKHQGSIAVTSVPGDTRFRISLPGLRGPGEENRQNGK